MGIYKWGDIRIEVNEDATQDYYAESMEWDCTCGHCRNFVFLARERLLPGDMLEFLDTLRLPPEKATYVFELNGQEDDLLYRVTYRVVGRIVENPNRKEQGKTLALGDERMENGTILWCSPAEGPTSAKDFPEPCFDITFELNLPWKDGKPLGANDVFISSDLEEDISEIEKLLQKVIPAVLFAEDVRVGCEINVLITNDEGIHAINLAERGVDAPTDVLSFPMFDLKPGDKPSEADADPGSHLVPLGDMVLNLDRVRSQGEEYGHGPRRECAYLAVHSVLHLLGYDHMDDGPMKAQMRQREEAILGQLGIGR